MGIIFKKHKKYEHLGLYIESVIEGGAAHLNGRLNVGDEIRKVDGKSLIGIPFERVVDLVRQSGHVVELEVAKKVTKTIHLEKINDKLGIKVKTYNKNETGMRITGVEEGGAAYQDGRLEVGDEILLVNGINLIGISCDQALDIIGRSRHVVELEVAKTRESRTRLSELEEYVKSLRVEANHIKAERQDEQEDETKCCICLDRRPEVVLVPCGHMNLCEVCALKWKLKPLSEGGGDCPNCRVPINIIQKIVPLH